MKFCRTTRKWEYLLEFLIRKWDYLFELGATKWNIKKNNFDFTFFKYFLLFVKYIIFELNKNNLIRKQEKYLKMF